jgi:hypothetical protein
MASHFMVRDDCWKRLRELCDNDTFKTAFALGFSVQLLELGDLNELVEAVELWSGNLDGERSLPNRKV